jgi:hypothetical protein
MKEKASNKNMHGIVAYAPNRDVRRSMKEDDDKQGTD